MHSQSRQKGKQVQQQVGGGGGEVADWVYDLLDEFGVDEGLLYEDEPPGELTALLPLAKGFIEGGGLKKLMQQPAVQGGESPPNLDV